MGVRIPGYGTFNGKSIMNPPTSKIEGRRLKVVGPPYGRWEPLGPDPGATYPTSLTHAAGVTQRSSLSFIFLFAAGGAPLCFLGAMHNEHSSEVAYI